MPSQVEEERGRARMEGDFAPLQSTGNGLDVDARINQTAALEYIAYRFGQIDKKLDRLIEAAERIAANYPKPKA